jgi:hypothetical protein
MIITSDSEKIFEFLYEQHRLPKDFSVDDLQVIEHDQNFHIAYYASAENKKGFTMFSVVDFQNNPTAMQQLLQYLQDNSGTMLPEKMLEKALREVENRIIARPGGTLFFDGH